MPNQDTWRLFCRSLLLPVEMAEPLGPKAILVSFEDLGGRGLHLGRAGATQVGASLVKRLPREVLHHLRPGQQEDWPHLGPTARRTGAA